MGIEIKCKKVKKVDMYQLRSSISDELYHKEKWITLDEAKKVLIENSFWKFFETIVEIGNFFPQGWSVNGLSSNNVKFLEHSLSNYLIKNGGKKLDADFQEIMQRYDIEVTDPKPVNFGLYEVDTNPGYNGLPSIYKLVAASDKEEKLVEFCQTEYNTVPRSDEACVPNRPYIYYTIKPFALKIV